MKLEICRSACSRNFYAFSSRKNCRGWGVHRWCEWIRGWWSATNADLHTLIAQGKFREDLYYRLSAFPLAIPALRERPGDVAELARYFLKRFSADSPAPVLTRGRGSLLQAQRWPGNIRELQNVIERALILADGDPRAAGALDADGARGAAHRARPWVICLVPAVRVF